MFTGDLMLLNSVCIILSGQHVQSTFWSITCKVKKATVVLYNPAKIQVL